LKLFRFDEFPLKCCVASEGTFLAWNALTPTASITRFGWTGYGRSIATYCAYVASNMQDLGLAGLFPPPAGSKVRTEFLEFQNRLGNTGESIHGHHHSIDPN
jgi:hypothetical protein